MGLLHFLQVEPHAGHSLTHDLYESHDHIHSISSCYISVPEWIVVTAALYCFYTSGYFGSDSELVFYSLGDVSSRTQCICQIRVKSVEYEAVGSHSADTKLDTAVNLMF